MDKNSQIYKKMSVSYIAVVIVFVVIVFVGYFCSYDIIRDQAFLYNKKLLETVKSVCDREIDAYYDSLYTFNFDEELRDYVSRSEYESPSARVETYKMIEKLAELRDSMGELSYFSDGLFVYLTEQDKLVSAEGIMNLKQYTQRYFDDELTEKVRRVLAYEERQTLVSFQSVNGNHYILLFHFLVDNKMKKGSAVIGTRLNLRVLADKIDSVAWDQDVDWAMVDEAGNILLCSEWLETALSSGKLAPDAEKISLNGQEYLLNRLDSDGYSWQFVMFTNSKHISSAATKMELVYFICAFVLLLAGYESVRILMKLHYSPIKKLAMTVSDGTDEKIQDEYQFIEKRMSGLVNMHKDVQSNLSRSNRVVRDYLLEEMLSSSTIEKKELAICEEIYSKFSIGVNVVVICKILEDEKNLSNSNEEERELNHFIVSNIYEEEMSHYFLVEVLQLEDSVVMIVNLRENGEDYSEVFQAVNDKLREFLRRYSQFDVCMYEGNSYPGVEGIHQSYLEACKAEEYLRNTGIFYGTYRSVQEFPFRSYDYSFGMEERLYNAVRSGNEKQACSCVEIILKNNLNTKSALGSDVQTCLLYDIYGTLLKASEEQGIRNGNIMAAGSVFARADMEEINAFFRDRIHEVCNKISDRDENVQWKNLCQSVLAYIHENYTDPDLNLAQTAIHFDLTPAYLAAKYKQYMGSNISDTIKEMRIEYSKVLLKEDFSIKEIAEKVGFSESSSFIRFFKKYTGMTPGQMREMDEKK